MAELTTVYFKNDRSEIVKAIIPVNQVVFFESLGARQLPDDFLIENGLPKNPRKENAPDIQGQAIGIDSDAAANPDQGFGRPGSIRFHIHCIKELQDIDGVGAYLQDVTGQGMDARIKKLEKAQRYAIQTIKDWIKENDRQS